MAEAQMDAPYFYVALRPCSIGGQNLRGESVGGIGDVVRSARRLGAEWTEPTKTSSAMRPAKLMRVSAANAAGYIGGGSKEVVI